jgi:CRP-like cAMP-binding protein
VFLAKAGLGRTIIKLDNKERAFSQGDAAASVFYIQSGRIRLSVIAKTGKEATVALLGAGYSENSSLRTRLEICDRYS